MKTHRSTIKNSLYSIYKRGHIWVTLCNIRRYRGPSVPSLNCVMCSLTSSSDFAYFSYCHRLCSRKFLVRNTALQVTEAILFHMRTNPVGALNKYKSNISTYKRKNIIKGNQHTTMFIRPSITNRIFRGSCWQCKSKCTHDTLNILLVRCISNTHKENRCTVKKKRRIKTKLGPYLLWLVKRADFQMYDRKVTSLSVITHSLKC
jgi:hypothetical protein